MAAERLFRLARAPSSKPFRLKGLQPCRVPSHRRRKAAKKISAAPALTRPPPPEATREPLTLIQANENPALSESGCPPKNGPRIIRRRTLVDSRGQFGRHDARDEKGPAVVPRRAFFHPSDSRSGARTQLSGRSGVIACQSARPALATHSGPDPRRERDPGDAVSGDPDQAALSLRTRSVRRDTLRDAVFLCTTPLEAARMISGSAAARAA